MLQIAYKMFLKSLITKS